MDDQKIRSFCHKIKNGLTVAMLSPSSELRERACMLILKDVNTLHEEARLHAIEKAVWEGIKHEQD